MSDKNDTINETEIANKAVPENEGQLIKLNYDWEFTDVTSYSGKEFDMSKVSDKDITCITLKKGEMLLVLETVNVKYIDIPMNKFLYNNRFYIPNYNFSTIPDSDDFVEFAVGEGYERVEKSA